jgi:hypothetical protein
MISGTVAVTTTPQSLQGASTIEQTASQLLVQVIGAGTVIIGSKAGVTAGNGIQLASTNGPISLCQSGALLGLTDVWVVATTGTATLMYTGV